MLFYQIKVYGIFCGSPFLLLKKLEKLRVKMVQIRAGQTECCYDRLFLVIIHARSTLKKIKLAKLS